MSTKSQKNTKKLLTNVLIGHIIVIETQNTGGQQMLKVTGLSELAEIIESNNRIEKAEREIKKNRIKELIAEGIDKEIARVMVEAGLSCGVQL